MTNRLFTADGICSLTGVSSVGGVGIGFFFVSECERQCAMHFFQAHLREPLFIGLLTVATFLFSLKTFIVVTMHDKVYSTQSYEDEWRRMRQLDGSLRRYAPLERFARLLFLSILTSLVGCSLQFTLGVLNKPFAAGICIAVSIWSILMIFVSLFFLQKNLLSWFKFLDDASKT